MQILVAPLENFILGEKTFLRENVSLEATTLLIKNAGNFVINDFIVIGTIGTETAEIRRIDSISSDLREIVITEKINFNHGKLEPIQVIRFDKRKFYRSDSEDGAYSHLSSEGSPVDIQVDIPEGTRFEDATGNNTHYYKATYWNSFSGDESSLDDAVASKASDVDHYTSIYRIRQEAGMLENDFITSDIIDSYRVEAEAQVEGAIASVYSIPFSYIPRLLQHIVSLLAAGHLLMKEYGMEADVEISKTGQRKIERAEALLGKIAEGDIILIGEDGTPITKVSSFLASNSNEYDSSRPDKGNLFNLESEHFKFTDPDEPLSSSLRIKRKIKEGDLQ